MMLHDCIVCIFPDKRTKAIKKGRIAVIAHLCSLPKTSHDYNSFIVDVDHVAVSRFQKKLL